MVDASTQTDQHVKYCSCDECWKERSCQAAFNVVQYVVGTGELPPRREKKPDEILAPFEQDVSLIVFGCRSATALVALAFC